MAIPSISYDAFRASNQAFATEGGPWYLSFDPRRDHTACASINSGYCDGYCVQCRIFPPGDVPTYHATFSANISINMAQYGGGNRVDFTWTFWPLFCGTGIPAGTLYPIHSQIGDIGWDESFPTVDFRTWDSGTRVWNPASRITHTSSASVSRSGDTGYLPISISFDLSPTGNSQYLDYYVKGIGLQIGGSGQGDPPAAGAQVSRSASGSTSMSFVPPSTTMLITTNGATMTVTNTNLSPIPMPGWVSGNPFPHSSDASGSFTPIGTVSSQVEFQVSFTGLVVGATVGGTVFSALFIIVLLLCLRRRRRWESTKIVPISPVTADGGEKYVIDEVPKTESLASRWNKKLSRQTSISVTAIDVSSQNQANHLVPPMPSIKESRERLLGDVLGTPRPGSAVPSENGSRRASSFNLPDYTLGGCPELSHPFSTRSSSIFSGIPYDPAALGVYDPENEIRNNVRRSTDTLVEPAAVNLSWASQPLEGKLSFEVHPPIERSGVPRGTSSEENLG